MKLDDSLVIIGGIIASATLGFLTWIFYYKRREKILEYRRLGPEEVEPRKRLDRAEAMWKRAIHITAFITLAPFGIVLQLGASSSAGFIASVFGIDLALILVVFLATWILRRDWQKLFSMDIGLRLCATLAVIGFLTTLTMLSVFSILSDPSLSQRLIEQVKKALGG